MPSGELADVARARFEIEALTGFQRDAVEAVLNGHDCLIMQPTASGKSLCFVLPSLMQAGMTVVISPLIALMADQVASLTSRGVRAAFLHADLPSAAASQVERQAEQGELDLLYVAPERFQSEHFCQVLSRARLGLIALDEAHCVSAWGDDFRPDYRRIGPALDRFERVPRMALTATANAQTRTDISDCLTLCEPLELLASPLRKNLTIATGYRQRGYKQLLALLQRPLDGKRATGKGTIAKTIVYVPTRSGVDQLEAQLSKAGLRCAGYHAGRDSSLRLSTQEAFKADKVDVLIATIAFGLGVDIPGVRRVVRLGLSNSLEALLQEIGRAGRDGRPAQATVLFNERDVAWLLSHQTDQKGKVAEGTEDLFDFLDVSPAERDACLANAFQIPQPLGAGETISTSATSATQPTTKPGHAALESLIEEVVATWPENASATFIQDLLGGNASSSVRSRDASHHPLFARAVRSEATHQALMSTRLIIRRLVIERRIKFDLETGMLGPA